MIRLFLLLIAVLSTAFSTYGQVEPPPLNDSSATKTPQVEQKDSTQIKRVEGRIHIPPCSPKHSSGINFNKDDYCLTLNGLALGYYHQTKRMNGVILSGIMDQEFINGVAVSLLGVKGNVVSGAHIGLIGVVDTLNGIGVSLYSRTDKVNGIIIAPFSGAEVVNGAAIGFVSGVERANGLFVSALGISRRLNGVAASLLIINIDTLNGLALSLDTYAKTNNGLMIGLLNNVSRPLYNDSLSGSRNNGVQLGLYNRVDKNRSLQVGFINHSVKNRGLQIGLFNHTVESGGLQIGLLNLKKGHSRPMPLIRWW